MSAARELVQTVSGCRVFMRRGGAGPPLLFLHGAGGVGAWLPFLRYLAERFDVICPDHPGFGRSGDLDHIRRIGDFASFYGDFIADLGVTRVHLVGASLGGWIATELAVRDTTALASLTLIAPCGLAVPGAPTANVFEWSAEERVRNLYADPRLAEFLLALPPNPEEQAIQARNEVTTQKVGREPLLHNPQLGEWLPRIDRPTLLLWGEDDRVVPPSHGPVFRDRIAGARLEVVRGCGHVPHIEKPALAAALIADFIAAVDG